MNKIKMTNTINEMLWWVGNFMLVMGMLTFFWWVVDVVC